MNEERRAVRHDFKSDRITGATEAEIMQILEELASRGLVKRMDDQSGGWTRRVQMDETTGTPRPPSHERYQPQCIRFFGVVNSCF